MGLFAEEVDRSAAEVGPCGDLWDAVDEDNSWEITPSGTAKQIDPASGAFLREIGTFNDGEWAVLEPWKRELDEPQNIPENVQAAIRRATAGAWRCGACGAGWGGVLLAGGSALKAEAFGLLPPA